jgi:hypothetical protein
MARPRTELGCVRCQRNGVKHGANFPEGRICRRCYQRALCRRGPCSSCHETRLLPGQTETGLLLCRDCAGIIQDFHGRQCGEEDEPQRDGRCARCCLRELLAGILDDGHGAVNDRLVPLHEAICAQARPRSAIIWLRNPDVRRLLSDLATGRLPIEYASFEAHPSPKTATHLRDLFVEHGVLDPVNRDLALFEGWLARTLPATEPTALLVTTMDCHALNPLLAEAQSVPTATEVVCIRSLPPGWTLGRVQAFRGTSVITLGNDRAGSGALQLTLTGHCAVGRAAPVRAPAPGIRRLRALDGSRFAATWYDIFPGGCVTIELRPATQQAAADQGLAGQIPVIVGYLSRAALRDELAQRSGGRLQLN